MSGKERLENANPHIFAKSDQRIESPSDWDDDVYDPFDAREIFDLVRSIRDPEHPLTLEQLNVVSYLWCWYQCVILSISLDMGERTQLALCYYR